MKSKLIIAATLVLVPLGGIAAIILYGMLLRPPVQWHDEIITLNNGVQALVPEDWRVLNERYPLILLNRYHYEPPLIWQAMIETVAIVEFVHFAGPEEAQKFYDNYFSSPELFEQRQLAVIQNDGDEVLEYETKFLQINGQRAISFEFVGKDNLVEPPFVIYAWIVRYYVPGFGLEVRGYIGQDNYRPEMELLFRRIIESVVLPKGG